MVPAHDAPPLSAPSGRGASIIVRDPFSLDRLTLRFHDAAQERAFAAEQARKAIRPLRAGLVFVSVMLVAVYLATDFILHELSVTARGPVVLNLVVIGATCGLAFALTYWHGFAQRQQLIAAIFASLVSLDIPLVTALGPADIVVSRGWGIMLLHTIGIYSLARLRFPQATLAGWFGLGVYCLYMGSIGALDGEALVRHAVTLGFGNLWGMLICYQLDLAARHEFSAMRLLNRIFSEFDALADAHGLEKIKTIGDAYMAVAGLPDPQADHAPRAARMALAMLEATARVSAATGEALSLRIGLHSGPVVAGVIGLRKFAYDLWGDTVNTASRMEHHGLPGAIQCSEATARLLQGAFDLQHRGLMEIKGKGEMATYLLTAGAPTGVNGPAQSTDRTG